jgi:predicted small lipoprotein YifL
LDRRQFSLAVLAVGLAAGVSACGRRGPLEPPAYTEQGKEWNRRQGRNPDGTRKAPGQTPDKRPQPASAKEGSVKEGLEREADARNTVDVESDLERNRAVEGQARDPSDPARTEPAAGTPTPSPSGARRRPPGILPPKRSFILDPLL